MAAPYFEPAVAVPYAPGFIPGQAMRPENRYDVRVINTDDSNFQLTAEKLEAAIKDAGGADNVAGILITSPNHITQAHIPEDELKKIGEVVVSNKLHVISDELYDMRPNGKKSNEPPSIAAMKVTVDGHEHRLHDYVFTCDGTSKRFNLQGRDGYPKAGFGTSGDERWMDAIKKAMAHKSHLHDSLGICTKDDDNGDMLRISYMLEHTPDKYFQDNAKQYADYRTRTENMLAGKRSKYGLSEQDIFIKKSPDHAYLMFLEFSPELAKKIGVQDANQFYEYFSSYAGTCGYSETGAGTDLTGFRITPIRAYLYNPNKPEIGAAIIEESLDRMCQAVANIKNGTAPSYDKVREHTDKLMREHLDQAIGRAHGEGRRTLLDKKRYAFADDIGPQI